jgi:hypothetical protein
MWPTLSTHDKHRSKKRARAAATLQKLTVEHLKEHLREQKEWMAPEQLGAAPDLANLAPDRANFAVSMVHTSAKVLPLFSNSAIMCLLQNAGLFVAKASVHMDVH